MTENGFSQYVDSPTRGNNVLDFIYVNDDFALSGLNIIPPFSTSDHNSVIFNLVHLSHCTYSNMFPKYKFSDDILKSICEDLKLVNWDCIFYSDDLDNVWNDFC